MANIKLIGNDDASYSVLVGGGYLRMQKFSALFSGILKVIMVKNAGTDARVGLYADNSGEPGSLIVLSGYVPTGGGWVSIAVPDTPIIASTTYWLAVDNDTGHATYVISSGGISRQKEWDPETSFPDPAGAGYTSGTRVLAIAGWGEVAAAGCPRQTMFFKMMG